MLHTRVAHDYLNMTGQVIERKIMAEREQRMLGLRDRYKRNVDEELTEEAGGHVCGHDDISKSVGYCLLGAGEYRVGQLHLRTRTEVLQLGNDLQQAAAWESGVHHKIQFRLPALFETARKLLERIQVAQDAARSLKQGLTVRGKHGLSTLDDKQRQI
jgi:hypothetical protein